MTSRQELIAVMAIEAAERAGEIARAAGYPQPTAEQGWEVGRVVAAAFTAFVSGLVDLPDREPTDYEKAAIAAVIEGIAEGAVLRVFGEPPGFEASVN